jgi:hypothetical protein
VNRESYHAICVIRSQVLAYGPQTQYQLAVLYSCTPAAESGSMGATACTIEHATNHSTVPWAFADQFSRVQMSAPSDDLLIFTSKRGNAATTVISKFDLSAARLATATPNTTSDTAATTWEPVWVSPFNLPSAVGGKHSHPSAALIDVSLSTACVCFLGGSVIEDGAEHDSAPNAIILAGDPKHYHYIDGSLATFGGFAPVDDATPFNVPFEIVGQFVPLNKLGTNQPYPSGASGGWGKQFTAGEHTWYACYFSLLPL